MNEHTKIFNSSLVRKLEWGMMLLYGNNLFQWTLTMKNFLDRF